MWPTEKHLYDQAAQISERIPAFNLSDFYFAGGCIYSLWNGRDIHDYDIFCRRKEPLKRLIAYLEKNPHLVNCRTKNAITCGKLQFVTRHIGEPQVEVAKFDFLHNCFYFDASGLHAVFGWEQLDSTKLVFNAKRSRDVLNILTRIPKFLKRGMEIDQANMLEILERGTKPQRFFHERGQILKRRRGKGGY